MLFTTFPSLFIDYADTARIERWALEARFDDHPLRVSMRGQMSGFDIRALVSELEALKGAYCKKIYQPHHVQLVLRIRPKDGEVQDLVIIRGKRLYLSQRERPMPAQPAPFAMLLRKHLTNARLTGVRQHGFDRILTLSFDTREGQRHVVVECFRDGNVILTDATHTIIQPLTHAKYAARTLKKGEPYLFPPEALDPHNLDEKMLADLLKDSDRELVRTLAGKANLGGPLANAVISLSDVDGKMVAKQAAAEPAVITSVCIALKGLLAELAESGKDGESGGWLLLQVDEEDDESIDSTLDEANSLKESALDDYLEARAVEASPVLFPAHTGLAPLPYERMGDAIDAWKGRYDSSALMRRREEAEAVIPGRGPSTVAETLTRRREQQESALQSFQSKIEKKQAIGHAIKEHWTHVEDLLSQVKEAIDELGWEETRKRVRSIEWIESADPVARTIRAILPDESGGSGGILVTLHVYESVHQNAQRYFEAARKQKEKSVGAEDALDQTKTELKRAEKKEAKREASGHVVRFKRSRRLWFERHRWSIMDGMHLFIGGRDSKGNDTLVKKHLGIEDRYFHADIHGAPSCVMKFSQGFELDANPPLHLPPSVPALRLVDKLQVEEFSSEATTQAATLSLCWSRAWSGGGGAGTAFWAKPGQVSKQAETGEYVARGAFIVRGQRTWLRDLETKLGLGLVCINGAPLLMGGTPQQVASLCQRWVEYLPGRTKKESNANRLAKATGLATDDILGVLPGPGEFGQDYGLFNPKELEEE